MNILIVEDDEFKADRLRTFVEPAVRHGKIEAARSYKSGLRALVGGGWSFVILDMSLPTFDIQPGSDGGRPLSLGGRELLRQMKRRGLKFPTVVVTGFDTFGNAPEAVTLAQLDDELQNEFGDFYLGSVYFDATTDEWRDRLKLLTDNLGGKTSRHEDSSC